MNNQNDDVRKWQVLVIEDSRELADIVRHLLTAEGAQVYTATTGEDAYTLLADIAPTFILLDMKLPDADGVTVLETVRSRFDSRIPIIAFTARAPIEAKELLDQGFDGYVLKPFRMDDFIKTLSDILKELK
ncbi:MAG: response regulator [Chloroflexi bacterium]|nr:response regulator [Chloroflexota bacterium]